MNHKTLRNAHLCNTTQVPRSKVFISSNYTTNQVKCIKTHGSVEDSPAVRERCIWSWSGCDGGDEDGASQDDGIEEMHDDFCLGVSRWMLERSRHNKSGW